MMQVEKPRKQLDFTQERAISTRAMLSSSDVDCDDEYGSITRKQLECPVCCETCISPIYMCVNGHNVCGSCQQLIAFCPICCVQGQPVIRNLLAEEISSHNWTRCKSFGCTAVTRAERMPAHLSACPFGARCLLERCDWLGPPSAHAVHVRNVHCAGMPAPTETLEVRSLRDAYRAVSALLGYLCCKGLEHLVVSYAFLEIVRLFFGSYLKSVWTEVWHVFLGPLTRAVKADKLLAFSVCSYVLVLALVYFVLAFRDYDCLPNSYAEDRYLRWLDYYTET